MKRKTYIATISNNSKIIRMLVGGYNKPSVKNELTDFFIKTNQIIDLDKFDVQLKEVVNINGDYKTIE